MEELLERDIERQVAKAPRVREEKSPAFPILLALLSWRFGGLAFISARFLRVIGKPQRQLATLKSRRQRAKSFESLDFVGYQIDSIEAQKGQTDGARSTSIAADEYSFVDNSRRQRSGEHRYVHW